MENILGALGGGGGNNPLGQIFGMMRNGGLGNFMKGVQQSMNPQDVPDDPFGMSQVNQPPTKSPNDPMNPIHQMKLDAEQAARRSSAGRPDPFQQPVKQTTTKRSAPSPMFNERTQRFENAKKAKTVRVPSPVFGEPQPAIMEGPDEDDFKGEDNRSIYDDTQSMQTMDCDSSDGDVSNVD